MRTLSEQLLRVAPRLVCEEGLHKIKLMETPKDILDYYKEHVDFGFNYNFPTTEFLKEVCGDILVDNGFYIDEGKTYLKNPECLVTMGSSDLCLHVSDYMVSQIYAKEDSKIDLMADFNAFVMIDVFDNVEIKAEARDEAKIVINVYGEAKAETVGNVKVNKKHRNRY